LEEVVMKLGRWTAVALAVALAAPLAAGEKGKKCEMDTQACLTKMATALKDRGWVGIEMDETSGRLTLTRVVPGSPAEAAGLRAGDVLVALNGVPFGKENEAKVKATQKAMTPGAKITYTVSRDGKDQPVEGTLGPLPREVLAQWVGAHMLDGHTQTADK
jgi:S1-C subfamily serine protease